MLYHDRIDISHGIDMSKKSASKERNFCHYWYFLNKGFQFQTYILNRCPDLLMISVNLNIYVLNIRNVDYRCFIIGISKSETIKLLKNIDLTEKIGTLSKNKYQNQF